MATTCWCSRVKHTADTPPHDTVWHPQQPYTAWWSALHRRKSSSNYQVSAQGVDRCPFLACPGANLAPIFASERRPSPVRSTNNVGCRAWTRQSHLSAGFGLFGEHAIDIDYSLRTEEVYILFAHLNLHKLHSIALWRPSILSYR